MSENLDLMLHRILTRVEMEYGEVDHESEYFSISIFYDILHEKITSYGINISLDESKYLLYIPIFIFTFIIICPLFLAFSFFTLIFIPIYIILIFSQKFSNKSNFLFSKKLRQQFNHAISSIGGKLI